jgi:hypothetical protein
LEENIYLFIYFLLRPFLFSLAFFKKKLIHFLRKLISESRIIAFADISKGHSFKINIIFIRGGYFRFGLVFIKKNYQTEIFLKKNRNQFKPTGFGSVWFDSIFLG